MPGTHGRISWRSSAPPGRCRWSRTRREAVGGATSRRGGPAARRDPAGIRIALRILAAFFILIVASLAPGLPLRPLAQEAPTPSRPSAAGAAQSPSPGPASSPPGPASPSEGGASPTPGPGPPVTGPGAPARWRPAAPSADLPPRIVYSPGERTFVALFVGNVLWSTLLAEAGGQRQVPVVLAAERLLVRGRLAGEARGAVASGETAGRGEEPSRGPGGLLGRLLPEELEDVEIYAEGARLEIPSRTTLFEADSLYLDQKTGLGALRDVRVQTTLNAVETLPSLLEAKTMAPISPSQEVYARSPLIIRAKILLLRGLDAFEGTDIQVTTCDYHEPHYSVHSASARIDPVKDEATRPAPRPRSRREAGGPARGAAPPASRGQGGAPAPGAAKGAKREATADTPRESAQASESPQESARQGLQQNGREKTAQAPAESGPEPPRHFVIDPEDTWVDVLGAPVAPLPLGKWDTRWSVDLPIRKLGWGRSSQFGTYGEVSWNLNYFLSLLPPSRFLPVEIVNGDARLGFDTDLFQKRGVGYGPTAQYGQRPDAWEPWQLGQDEWQHHGEARYYRIHDEGEEDRSTRRPIPRDDRFWGGFWHRQSVPYLGTFDLEYSKLSDSAFLGEYFESIAKQEKEQETLAYYRRNITDNFAITALEQVRVNDFETETERLPEGKLFLFQQPVAETGLYVDLDAQAAYLHTEPADGLPASPRGYGRYDVFHQWAYPVAALQPYVQMRPFVFGRYTYYGETLDVDDGPDDRGTLGGGIAASQEWSRAWRFGPDSIAKRILGLDDLRHVLVPKIRYLNTFVNDLDPEDVFAVDAADTVSLEESITFSLRNSLFTRRALAGGEQTVQPHLKRRQITLTSTPTEIRRLLDSDVSFSLFPRPLRDNRGERSSLLILDNTIHVLPRLPIRAWLELDPNEDFHASRMDLSTTLDALPRRLSVTVGDRFTQKRSNVGFLQVLFTPTEKWMFDVYYARDFERRRDVEYFIGLHRIFHRFALSLEYTEDVGEDRNRGFRINFMPLELLRAGRGRGYGARR